MDISMTDDTKFFDNQLLSNIMEQKHAEVLSTLQSTDDIPKLVDDLGCTLLHYAAQYGNATVAKYLIDVGCKIDSLDESRNSPLMLAVRFEHIETIELLLKANADVDIRGAYGSSILESVLQPGVLTRSAEVKALFLNKVRVMCADDDTLIANKLTEAGCNLIEAIRLNRPAVVKAMLEKGSSIKDRDVHCNTALHVAVELMNLEIIQLLVEHGARVNARGCHGRTPISKYDMKFENTSVKLDILRYLLEKGASVTIQDLFGMTPLTFILCGADREILEVVMQFDVDLCGFNKFRQNSLHYLVENQNPGILKAIRGKKFEVNARNSLGLTPLLLAVRNYDIEKIKFLLEHGADVNAKSPDGHTALLLLFMNRLEDEKNVSDILELLLEHGADMQATFEQGMTIFDLAEKNDFCYRVKPVIARMVMCEMIGKPIDKWVRAKVRWNLIFEHHYEKCKQQINELRDKIVYGSVCLFKLLFETEDKLVLYARNDEFESKFRGSMEHLDNVDEYIRFVLRKRVAKAIMIANLKKRVAITICRITDLPISTSSTILYNIIDYLDNQDLRNLDKF